MFGSEYKQCSAAVFDGLNEQSELACLLCVCVCTYATVTQSSITIVVAADAPITTEPTPCHLESIDHTIVGGWYRYGSSVRSLLCIGTYRNLACLLDLQTRPALL
jgi:hypothetical protein